MGHAGSVMFDRVLAIEPHKRAADQLPIARRLPRAVQ